MKVTFKQTGATSEVYKVFVDKPGTLGVETLFLVYLEGRFCWRGMSDFTLATEQLIGERDQHENIK